MTQGDATTLEESICSLMFQWDTYLQEIHEAYVYLTDVYDALSSLNRLGSLFDQVTFLVRGIIRKDKVMAYVLDTLSSK